jgi:energy-coupling factor transport system ATP-binding protein
MLKAERVTYRYLGASEDSIVSADVTCSDGSVNLVWGDNGSGKSTLALILCGAIPHLLKGRFSGNVFWNHEVLSEKLMPTLSSFVFQNPYIFFQGFTIQDELDLITNKAADLAEAARVLLPRVPLETSLHTLSLGQQERVAICSAILRSEPMVFLDEPFESLDDSGVKQTIELITRTSATGRIVNLIQRPQQREYSLRCDKGYQIVRGSVKEGFPGKAPKLPPINKPTPGAASLILRDLSFRYSRNSGFAIKNLNLSISAGEIVGLIGANGSGKSTLLMLMSGLLNPGGGSISLHGKELKGKYLRRQVKCAFQNPEAQLFANSVREELEFGLLNSGLSKSEMAGRFGEIIEQLPYELTRDPFSLSFGQKKILSIVATFLLEPKVVLLDEPTAGLDVTNVLIFHKLVERFLQAGGSIMISSHNLPEIEALADRVLTMSDGELVEERKGSAVSLKTS